MCIFYKPIRIAGRLTTAKQPSRSNHFKFNFINSEKNDIYFIMAYYCVLKSLKFTGKALWPTWMKYQSIYSEISNENFKVLLNFHRLFKQINKVRVYYLIINLKYSNKYTNILLLLVKIRRKDLHISNRIFTCKKKSSTLTFLLKLKLI